MSLLQTPSEISSNPRDWQWMRLDAVCNGNIFDCPHSTPIVTEDGPLMVRTQDILTGIFRHEQAAHVSEDSYLERIRRVEPSHGDLVYSREGTYFGIAAEVPKHVRVCLGQRMVLMRSSPDMANFRFLRFWLNSPIMSRYIHGFRDGSVAERLNLPTIRALPVLLPPLCEQEAIACILSAFDDKIELNRRMNRTLEGLARALFQSWFVDFDPVRTKAAGKTPPGLVPPVAKLFPDAFEDSELGEIPQGWKVGKFGDVAEERRRSVNADNIAENTPYIALEHMPRRSITLDQWDFADSVASGKLRFNRGEILFGKLRPYFHKVGVAPIDGVCSTDIVVLGPRSPEFAGVVLEHSASDAFVAHADRTSAGTKMPRTNWRDMAQYPLVVPLANIAARFSHAVAPLIDRIQSACSQSRVLAALRDALLPKLISGELRVPDAERIAGRYL